MRSASAPGPLACCRPRWPARRAASATARRSSGRASVALRTSACDLESSAAASVSGIASTRARRKGSCCTISTIRNAAQPLDDQAQAAVRLLEDLVDDGHGADGVQAVRVGASSVGSRCMTAPISRPPCDRLLDAGGPRTRARRASGMTACGNSTLPAQGQDAEHVGDRRISRACRSSSSRIFLSLSQKRSTDCELAGRPRAPAFARLCGAASPARRRRSRARRPAGPRSASACRPSVVSSLG